MPDGNESYVASGTIGVMRFVKQGGAPFRVSEAGAASSVAGDLLIGVSQEGSVNAPGLTGITAFPAANDGDRLHVYGRGDRCMLIAGATVSAGNWLKSDANSFGTPISMTATANPEYYGFRALENAVSGTPVRGVVDIGFYIDN